MDLPGVPAGGRIIRGAFLGAPAGMGLALFTHIGSSIDLDVLIGLSLELTKACIQGDLTTPVAVGVSMNTIRRSWPHLESCGRTFFSIC